MPTCKNCQNAFEITQSDLDFYAKLSYGPGLEVPPPTLCPNCRLQRRLTYRNEPHLYKNICALCKKPTISLHSPDSGYKIFCQDCWWSDKWDPHAYAQDFDFNKTFFEQYSEMQKAIPRISLMNKAPENSEFCNYAGYNKNCYLAVGGSWYSEDCYYGRHYNHCRNCCDCESLKMSELCYESVWGSNLYNCVHCFGSYNSGYCYFSVNLRGCNNCIFCSNLRNKTYYIYNKPATKEEFEKLIKQLLDPNNFLSAVTNYKRFKSQAIYPPSYQTNCENCTGDYLENCKNVQHGSNVFDGEDCKYVVQAEGVKDVMDCSSIGYDHPQLFYETINTGTGGFNGKFTFNSWECTNVTYGDTVMNSQDCFGCVSMHNKKFCILNKQYSEEDYKKMRDRIILHMRHTKEYGEFFPIQLSPFGYNETSSQDYFPLTREQAFKKGYKWHDDSALEKSAANSADSQSGAAPTENHCQECGKLFRLTPHELIFYKKINIPSPRKCFFCRHRERFFTRNLPNLFDRTCANCGTKIQTAFAPDRTEKIYCEKCYTGTLI